MFDYQILTADSHNSQTMIIKNDIFSKAIHKEFLAFLCLFDEGAWGCIWVSYESHVLDSDDRPPHPAQCGLAHQLHHHHLVEAGSAARMPLMNPLHTSLLTSADCSSSVQVQPVSPFKSSMYPLIFIGLPFHKLVPECSSYTCVFFG